MPLVLALDTTMGASSAALAEGDTLLAARFSLCRLGHSELLMGQIAAVLAEGGAALSDVSRIAVTTGPGSFTGARIGLAAARGLGLAAHKPVVGLGTLDVLAAEAAGRKGLKAGDIVFIAIDARRGEIYAQGFRLRDGGLPRELAPPAVLAPNDAVLPGGTVLVTGSGAGLLALSPRIVQDDAAPSAPDAAILARLGRYILVPEPYAPPGPLYLRAPDAKLPGGLPPARS
jgi:tRNA threonylcarbamoyladenosine biosynthesis protein TsaB